MDIATALSVVLYHQEKVAERVVIGDSAGAKARAKAFLKPLRDRWAARGTGGELDVTPADLLARADAERADAGREILQPAFAQGGTVVGHGFDPCHCLL